MLRIAILLFFIPCLLPAEELAGTWFDQRGGRLVFEIVETGEITGKYQPGKKHPFGGKSYSLVGWQAGDQIAFSVRFSQHVLQGWIGQLVEDHKGDKLLTQWYWSKDIADSLEAEKMWTSVKQGKDIFRRQPQQLAYQKSSEQPDFTGKWQNQNGSLVELHVDENGHVTGFYATAVGKPDETTRFPLVGFAQGDQVVFSVNFAPWETLTTWVGQHTVCQGQEVIVSHWLLNENISKEQEEEDLWQATTIGGSEFVKIGK